MPAEDIPPEQKYLAPPVTKAGEMSTPEKVLSLFKDHAVGMIKGLTTDLAGAPVDIINLIASPVTQALGIYSDKPIGGSGNIRELAGLPAEDKNLAETAGGLITPGGAAHAMIVAATRVGRDVGKASKLYSELMASGMTNTEARGRVFAETGVYTNVGEPAKTIISDVGAKLNNPILDNLGKVTLDVYKSYRLDKTIVHPEFFTAHPELKNLKVELNNNLRKDTAVMQPRNPSIFNKSPIDYIELGPASSAEQLRETLLHEMQHAVQEVSKFSPGTNPTAQRVFTDAAGERLKEVKQQLPPNPDISIARGFNALLDRYQLDRERGFVNYRNTAGEQESRFTEKNSNLSLKDLGQKLLELIRQGKTPQTHDTQPIPTKRSGY